MISPGQLANPKYGVLYLPTFVYLYLWSLPEPGQFYFWFISIPNSELYPVAAVITFVGALLAQNFFEVIYGPVGPKENPKYRTTALKHHFAIAMNVDPDSISESEMVTMRRAMWEIVDKCSPLNAIKGLAIILPIYSLRLLMFYSIFLVGFYLWQLGGDFVLWLLLLGSITMFAQDKVASLFPEVGSPESAEYLDVPEYKRFERNMSDDREMLSEAKRSQKGELGSSELEVDGDTD